MAEGGVAASCDEENHNFMALNDAEKNELNESITELATSYADYLRFDFSCEVLMIYWFIGQFFFRASDSLAYL